MGSQSETTEKELLADSRATEGSSTAPSPVDAGDGIDAKIVLMRNNTISLCT